MRKTVLDFQRCVLGFYSNISITSKSKCHQQKISITTQSIFSSSSFFFLRDTHAAYRSSQARGLIGAAAPDLHHSHSNLGHLTHWWRPGIKPAPSWILVGGFVTAEPQQELLKGFILSPLLFLQKS